MTVDMGIPSVFPLGPSWPQNREFKDMSAPIGEQPLFDL
jgi:hypothetical protein